MSKDWVENPDGHFVREFDDAVEQADRMVHSALLRWHLSHWHLISTAPSNQELEIRAIDGREAMTLPFPCRHTNKDEWINVDLGTRVAMQPVSWRVWHRSKSPQSHRSPVGNK